VVLLVGRRQDLRLIDVVHAEGLQDLRLDEVTDAALGHDRDGHRSDDAFNHVRVRHAGDATLGANVRGDTLECHDGNRSGILGDLGLLGIDDVHDDATLEHLGETGFDPEGSDLLARVRHVVLLHDGFWPTSMRRPQRLG